MAKYLGKSKESDEKLRQAVIDNRAKFKDEFRKITAAEVKALTPKQKRIYDKIKENQNIAAVPKDRPRNRLFNTNVRLREFDSETYVKVKRPSGFPKRKKKFDKAMANTRAEANQYRTNLDFPGASKGYGYPTQINPDGSAGKPVAGGMRIPKSKPKMAPKETRGRKAVGNKD